MPKLILIAIGGSLGAVARYLFAGFVHSRISGTFPIGTLCVNVLGCLAMGVVMGLIEDKGVLGPSARWIIVIGFLGSFTTLSALGYETVELLNDGQIAVAAANAVGNFALGIGAVILGRLIARAVIA